MYSTTDEEPDDLFFSLSFFSVSESTEWPAMGVLRREKKKKNNHQTKKNQELSSVFLVVSKRLENNTLFKSFASCLDPSHSMAT